MKQRALPLLLGLVLAAAFAEAVLRLLPVSTGYDVGAVDADNPIVRGSRFFHYTYSSGWNFHLENSGTLNNYGFRAPYDYRPDPRALLVIGNSYVQADAITPRDTMTGRLGVLLNRPAYALGADGSALADYLAAARWASDRFGARLLLVLLTTGDLNHSCMARAGKHYLRLDNGAMSLQLVGRAAPSLPKRLLNGSKLFRYVFDNLRVTANWPKGWRRSDDGPPQPDAVAASDGCTDAAFEHAATEFLMASFHEFETAKQARVMFVLAPGYRLEQHIAAGANRDIDAFALRAEQEGFAVVHLDSAFAAALRAGVRLDFLPIDGHWTAAANTLAAQVAADAISNDWSDQKRAVPAR